MIITKTPFRLSLFGGGTDYPAWFENNPCKVISAAMANYCYVHLRELPPFFDNKYRFAYSKVQFVNNIDDIEHPSIKACLEYTDIEQGLSISYDGDLPARSGIGSSSSFTVGLLNALYTLKGQIISKEELAKKAIYVEQNIIGENVGIQDQIMAAHGGLRIIEMGPGSNWESKPLVIDDKILDEFEDNVMLGFSGVSRQAEIQAKKQVDNIKQGKSDLYLHSMMSLTEEAEKVFTGKFDIKTVGNLLDAGWHLKRNLAEGVSDGWIDDIYNQAKQSGAYGGKLMGAGGGGFFFFLVPPSEQERFKQKMNQIKVWVPFQFDKKGSHIISYSE